MRLDKQLAKYYYTAAQARKVLGLDEEAFQYWVRKDRISKKILPGRVQGVYSKKEVNNLASQIMATILAEQQEGVEFKKATLDDLEQEVQLAHLVFGEKAEARNERRAFLQRNPDVDYHLYDQDKLVAYILIVPLKHSTILDYIEGRIKNIWTISPDDVEQFETGIPRECLLIDMVTTPTVPPVKRTYYGSRLLAGLDRTLEEMGLQGIQITKLYATSRTPSGIRMLKGADFEVIQHDEVNDRFAFELDIMKGDKKIFRGYKDALKQWVSKQNSVKKPRLTES